jgi:hypothetical protein
MGYPIDPRKPVSAVHEDILRELKLPNPTVAGALHKCIDAPFGVFGTHARKWDPLWGLSRDEPAAFAASWRAVKWLSGLKPHIAAQEISTLPLKHQDTILNGLRDGVPGEDEDGLEDWCEMNAEPADTLWTEAVTAELNQLNNGRLL